MGGIYIASKTIHAPRWRSLRDRGMPISCSWIDEAGKGETKDFSDLWFRCVKEASEAGYLLAYRESGEQLKGAMLEIGAALARSRQVLLVGFSNPADNFSFRHHKKCTEYESLESALSTLSRMYRLPEIVI